MCCKFRFFLVGVCVTDSRDICSFLGSNCNELLPVNVRILSACTLLAQVVLDQASLSRTPVFFYRGMWALNLGWWLCTLGGAKL